MAVRQRCFAISQDFSVRLLPLLLILLHLPACINGLLCECTDCIGGTSICETSGACYAVTVNATDSVQVTKGCIQAQEVHERCTNQSFRGIVCCYDNHCNHVGHGKGSTRLLRAVTDGGDSMQSINNTNNSSMEEEYKSAAIITASVCITFTVFIVALIISLSYCYCCRRGRNRVQRRDLESGHSDSRISSFGSYGGDSCEAIIPQGETIDTLVQASKPCSSLSLLIQRTIVRHTTLEKSIEKGQFCETFLGKWRRENVLVKIYGPKYEKLWFAETELYQIPHMRHENILSFVAADIVQRNSQMHHYLITEYHERGTLYEHLQRTVLDVFSAIQMALSIASGLTHLHLEFSDECGMKPAIAHQNLTSKSVLVKADGTCCISDLTCAIGNLELELQSHPAVNYRYIAPEVLQASVALKDIDSLRKADMYSYGLLLWEIGRRCTIQGMVEDAILPYSDFTGSDDPSLEEMREIVCEQQLRPTVPDLWNRDESMRVILRTVTECWHQNSAVRLTALRVRKTLEKLSSSVITYYDKNGKVVVAEIDRTQFHS